MTAAASLPDCLGEVFTVSEALAAGVGRATLRRLPAPHRGVRARTTPATPQALARAALPVLPTGSVLSHATAAEAHGLWLPRRLSDDPRVHVIVPPGTTPPRLPTVAGHRGEAQPVDVDGLPVCPAPAVVAQLAPHLRLVELVVLIDSVVRWRSSLTLGDVEAALPDGARGVRLARRALTLARPGSNSPRESQLRLWCTDAGLPEPELNGRVEALGRYEFMDLLWREKRVAAEYHGAYHFTSDDQRRRDVDRCGWVRRQGYEVVEVTRTHFATRGALDDVIDELARMLGVTPLPRAARGRTLR